MSSHLLFLSFFSQTIKLKEMLREARKTHLLAALREKEPAFVWRYKLATPRSATVAWAYSSTPPSQVSYSHNTTDALAIGFVQGDRTNAGSLWPKRVWPPPFP